MIAVGLRDLKAHLSHFMRLVQAGETVTITDHGQPVGQIVPVRDSLQARAADLVTAGLVAWSGQHLPPLEPMATLKGPPTMADLLLEDRG